MTAYTCLRSLLHTAISPCFPVFPFPLSRSYSALQAGFVFIAFIEHMYKTSLSDFPPRLQIFGLPWMELPLLYSVGDKPAKKSVAGGWLCLKPCVKMVSMAGARLPMPLTLLMYLS